MDYRSPEQEDYDSSAYKRKSAKGRKLVRWNPDLDQLVLLCVDHVCTKQGVAIPWDDIAHMVEPHLTGEAIKQHLVKIYKFREEDGHKVPPKLDRHQRRKAFAAAAIPTPTRGRGKKSATYDDDEETPQPQAAPVKPGRTLLFKKPETKAKRAPKKEAGTPKTPAIGRGRHKFSTEKAMVDVKSEDEEGGEFSKQKIKSVARGGKRGRKSKNMEESDDEEDTIYETPSKKPKTNNYLRARPSVNYAEQMAQEEDDDDDDDDLKRETVKNEQRSSQGSSNDYNAPPPHFSMTTPANSDVYQGYPAATTPGFDYSGNATPFDSSPTGGDYGMQGSHNFDQYAPPPMMHTPNGTSFNNDAFNPMFQYPVNNSLDFSGNTGYGHGGFPSTNHTGALPAMNNLSHSQAGNVPNQFGSTVTRDNMYDHNNGVLNRSDDENKGNIVVNGMRGGSSDTSADSPIANATGRNNSFNQHNTGGGLHLDTNLGANFHHQSNSFPNTSPTDLADGDTGITPDLAQTGFTPLPPTYHAPAHNDSGYFDAGDLDANTFGHLGNDFLDHGDLFDMGAGEHDF